MPTLRFPPFLLPLIFINITGHMALSGGRLTGSLFILDNGHAEALVGVFMALFSVVPVLTSLRIGRWVDSAGPEHAMRGGVIVLLLGAWLPVVYLSLPTLLITGVLIGFGFSVISMAGQHTVGHLVPGATPAEPARSPHVLDLLATPEMRRIYWVNALTASSWDLFIVMLPVLGHRLGFSASVIGTVFSFFAIGTFGARAGMPWLSRRYTEWQILRTVMVVITLIFFALPWLSLAPLLMAAGIVYGAAVGMSQPNMLSLIRNAAPPGRGGEAVGLRSVLSNGCSVVVPLAFGAALSTVSISTLLYAGAMVFGTGVWPAHRGAAASRRARQD